MNEVLTFNGKRLADFSCYWDGSQVFRRAEKQVNKYEVLGRSGDILVSDERYTNIIIPFNCFIKENFLANYHALIDYLQNVNGYAELRTTEEPDYFRLATFHSTVEPSMNDYNHSGQFVIEFDCMPQLWLNEGQVWKDLKSRDNVLINPTYSPAYPLFKVVSSGMIVLPFIRIEVDSTDNTPIYIDCSGGNIDAYSIVNGEKVNKNSKVGLSNVMRYDTSIPSGMQTIAMYYFSSAQIMPRWYRL